MQQIDLLSESDEDERSHLTINEGYAKTFEDRRKAYELRRLRRTYGDSDSDSEAGVIEDDEAVLCTTKSENVFADVLWKIRNNPESLKNMKKPLWDDEITAVLSDDEVQKSSQEHTPLTLKRQISEQLSQRVSDNFDQAPDSESHITEFTLKGNSRLVYDPDAEKTRARFLELAAREERSNSQEIQDDIIKVVPNTGPAQQEKSIQAPTKSVRFYEVLTKNKADTEEDKFLKDYFRGDGWRKIISTNEDLEEESHVEKPNRSEDFSLHPEVEKNDPQQELDDTKKENGIGVNEIEGQSRIYVYPRTAEQSLRNKSSSRKHSRQLKEERQQQAEQDKRESLQRLRRLKQEERKQRIEAISRVAGSESIKQLNLTDILKRDFDPSKWDEQMSGLFGENFYAEKDSGELHSDENENIENDYQMHRDSNLRSLQGTDSTDYSHTLKKSAVESQLLSDPSVCEALRDLQTPLSTETATKFRYATVPSQDIALDAIDILTTDDRTLNEIAPLRWYAPYATSTESRKFKYLSRQRTRELRSKHSGRLVSHALGKAGGFKASKKYRTESKIPIPKDVSRKDVESIEVDHARESVVSCLTHDEHKLSNPSEDIQETTQNFTDAINNASPRLKNRPVMKRKRQRFR